MRYEAKRITAEEFGRLFPSPNHIFNSVAFNELNKHKAAAVHYLAIMYDGKTRFGIVLGEREAECIKTLSVLSTIWLIHDQRHTTVREHGSCR